MKKSRYTPGPLYVGSMNDNLCVITKPPRPSHDYLTPGPSDLRVTAKVFEVASHDEGLANAYLYAASPDMHEALIEARLFIIDAIAGMVKLPDFDLTSRIVRKIDAAIAKAEGAKP